MSFPEWAQAIVAGVRGFIPKVRAARRGHRHVVASVASISGLPIEQVVIDDGDLERVNALTGSVELR
jgi:hypothetical protein